jgi:hypothetical protein
MRKREGRLNQDLIDSLYCDYQFGDCRLKVIGGSRLEVLCSKLKQEFPKLVMYRKSSKWYWRVVAIFLKVVTLGKQSGFLKKFTTTSKNLVAWGDDSWQKISDGKPGWDDDIWSTLMHEREHLLTFKKYGVLISALLYVLVFLPMLLAWGRAWFERPGYTATLRCWFILDREWACSAKARDWWIGQFTGPNYGWMWPFRKQVGKWYDQELQRLMKGEQIFPTC